MDTRNRLDIRGINDQGSAPIWRFDTLGGSKQVFMFEVILDSNNRFVENEVYPLGKIMNPVLMSAAKMEKKKNSFKK